MAFMKKTNILKMVSLILLAVSMIFFVLGVVFGGLDVYLVLIIPVIKANGIFGFLAILSLIGSIILYFISKFQHEGSNDERTLGKIKDDEHASTEWGGIIFIGPIPIVFGHHRIRKRFPKWIYLLIIGIMMMAIVYIFVILIMTFFIGS